MSTVPAELIVTRGEPTYAPIPKTSLLYVTDSDNDIFMDTKSQQYYTLLAGRWFRAKSLDGPWEWVAGSQLPRDFARISPESPKGHVLASIPGTEQAREAVIANQIPQTATVRRNEAKAERQVLRSAGVPADRGHGHGVRHQHFVRGDSRRGSLLRSRTRRSGSWRMIHKVLGPWRT